MYKDTAKQQEFSMISSLKIIIILRPTIMIGFIIIDKWNNDHALTSKCLTSMITVIW